MPGRTEPDTGALDRPHESSDPSARSVGRLLRNRGLLAAFAVTIAFALALGVAAGAHAQAAAPAGGVAAQDVGGGGAPGASLRRGSSGPGVAALQRKLRIAPDGAYGAQTAAAVRRLERRKGLKVDGVADPAVLRALGLRSADLEQAGDTSDHRAGGLTGHTKAILDKIAQCESGADPRAVSPDGRHRGKYQFDRGTWAAMGGSGDPAQASEAEQDRRAAKLLRLRGIAPWPNCA